MPLGKRFLQCLIFLMLITSQSNALQWLNTYDDPELQSYWGIEPYAVRHFHRIWESYNSLWLHDPDATAIRFLTGSLTYDSMILLEEARTTVPLSKNVKFRLHHKRVEDDWFSTYENFGTLTRIVVENEVQFNRGTFTYTHSSGFFGGFNAIWSSNKEYIDPGITIGYNYKSTTKVEFTFIGRDLFMKWLANKHPVDRNPYQYYLELRHQIYASIYVLVEGFVEMPSGYSNYRFSEFSQSESEHEYHHRIKARIEKYVGLNLTGFEIGTMRNFYDREDVVFVYETDILLNKQTLNTSESQTDLNAFYFSKANKWSWEANCQLLYSKHKSTINYFTFPEDSSKLGWLPNYDYGFSAYPRVNLRRYFGMHPYIEGSLQAAFKFRREKQEFPLESPVEQEAKIVNSTKLRYGFALGYTLNGGEVTFNGKTKSLPTGEFRIMYSFDDPYPEAGDFGGAGSAAFVLTW